MCKSAVDRAPQCGMRWSDQLRILVEDRLRMTPRLEQQLGVLGEVTEPQSRYTGLPRSEQLAGPT